MLCVCCSRRRKLRMLGNVVNTGFGIATQQNLVRPGVNVQMPGVQFNGQVPTMQVNTGMPGMNVNAQLPGMAVNYQAPSMNVGVKF